MELFFSILLVLPVLVFASAYGFKFLFLPQQVGANTVAALDDFDRQLVKQYQEVNVHRNRAYTFIAGLAVTTIFVIVLTEIMFGHEKEIIEQVEVADLAEETFEIPPTKIPPPPPPPKPKSVVVIEAPEELVEPEVIDSVEEEIIEEDFSFDEEEFDEPEDDEDDEVVQVAPSIWESTEVRAQPEGGMFVLQQNLMAAIFPRVQALGQAYINDLSAGTIMLNFVINENGSISDLQASTSVDPLVDKIVLEEFYRVARYTPGMNQGQRVKSRGQYPVVIAF